MLSFWHAKKEEWRYRYLPQFVDGVIDCANFFSAKLIQNKAANSILIDNSVIGYGVTHETAWVDNGTQLWGGKIEIDTGYAARIPVYSDEDMSKVAVSVRYLPAISRLAQTEKVTLFSSMELVDETWTQPVGRYSGYGYYDLSIFKDVTLKTLPDENYSMVMGPSRPELNSLREQQRQRLDSIKDPKYLSLVDALGPKNNQDAYHIWTAEKNGTYCFLTMDFKLIRNIKAQRRHKAIKGLKTKILSPEDYGRQFSLIQINPRLLTYHNASFPVLPSDNWSDSKRKRKKFVK